jgi:hypothetical protein
MAFRPRTSAEFVDWIERNPDGYYVNINTNGPGLSILHQGLCRHFWPPRRGINYVTFRKLCSLDRNELGDWARAENDSLGECSACKPE